MITCRVNSWRICRKSNARPGQKIRLMAGATVSWRNVPAFRFRNTCYSLGMPYDPAIHTGRLPRLAHEHYVGHTFVHWTMTIQDRSAGWLDSEHHFKLRELLCHALGAFDLACPSYCLMPDHGHFLWIGLSSDSNQRAGVACFRRAWNRELARRNCGLDRQAYDHVLCEGERKDGALAGIASYILANPQRAGIAAIGSRRYPYGGAVVPGYPELDPTSVDFWLRFWRIYRYRMSEGQSRRGPRSESLAASAT